MPGEHKIAFQLRSFTSPTLQHGHQYSARVVRGDFSRTFTPASCQYGSLRCPVSWQGEAVVHFKSGGPAPHGYQAKVLSVELIDAAKGKAVGKVGVDVTRALRTDPFQGVVEGLEAEFRMAGLGASVVIDIAVYPSTCPQPPWPSLTARSNAHHNDAIRAAAQAAVAAGGGRNGLQYHRDPQSEVSMRPPHPGSGGAHHRRTAAGDVNANARHGADNHARAIAIAAGAGNAADGAMTWSDTDGDGDDEVGMSASQRALDVEIARRSSLLRAAELEKRLKQATDQFVVSATRDRAVAATRRHWASGKYVVKPAEESVEITHRRAELRAELDGLEHGVVGAEESLREALQHLDAQREKLVPLDDANRRRDEVLRRQEALEREQHRRDVTDEAVALFAELDAADTAVQAARDALDLDCDGGETGLRTEIESNQELVQQLRDIVREDQRQLANTRAQLHHLDDADLEFAQELSERNRSRRSAAANAIGCALVVPPNGTAPAVDSRKSTPPPAAAAPVGPTMDDLFAGASAAPEPSVAPLPPIAATPYEEAPTTGSPPQQQQQQRTADLFAAPSRPAASQASSAPPDLFAATSNPPAASQVPRQQQQRPDLFGASSDRTPQQMQLSSSHAAPAQPFPNAATAIPADDLFLAAPSSSSKLPTAARSHPAPAPDLFGGEATPAAPSPPPASAATRSPPWSPGIDHPSVVKPGNAAETAAATELFGSTLVPHNEPAAPMPPSLAPMTPPVATTAPTNSGPSTRSLAAPASALEEDLFFGQPDVFATASRPAAAAARVAESSGRPQRGNEKGGFGTTTTGGVVAGFADDDDALFGDVEAWPPPEPVLHTKPPTSVVGAGSGEPHDLFAAPLVPSRPREETVDAGWPSPPAAVPATASRTDNASAHTAADLFGAPFGAPSSSRSNSAATAPSERAGPAPPAPSAFDPFRTGRSQQREEVDDDDLFA